MSSKQLPFFGEIKENSEYYSEYFHSNPNKSSNNVISLSLYADSDIDTSRTEKLASALENMDHLIEIGKNAINSTVVGDGFYYPLIEHKDFIFYECLCVDRCDYSKLFSEYYKDVSLMSFINSLVLKNITLSYRFNSITMDYYFPLDNNAIWAVHFDLDLKFKGMGGES